MFQCLYIGESEEWQEITEEKLRDRLDGYYKNIDLAIAWIREGNQLRTAFAFYRWISL